MGLGVYGFRVSRFRVWVFRGLGDYLGHRLFST